MQETQIIRVPSLGWEDPLKEGMTSHSSTLAWRIPWIEEPGGLQSIGLQKVVQVWATEQQQQNPNPNGLLSWSESSWGYVCDVPQVLGVTSSTIIISWPYVSDERAPLLKPNKGKEAEAKVLHDRNRLWRRWTAKLSRVNFHLWATRKHKSVLIRRLEWSKTSFNNRICSAT